MSSIWVVPFPSDDMKTCITSNYYLIHNFLFSTYTGCMHKIIIQNNEVSVHLRYKNNNDFFQKGSPQFIFFSLSLILIIPMVFKDNHYVTVIWAFKICFLNSLVVSTATYPSLKFESHKVGAEDWVSQNQTIIQNLKPTNQIT